MAEISYRSTILESWLLVETSAIEALQRNNVITNDNIKKSPFRYGDLLLNSGIFDENKYEIFNELKRLRNMAVHLPEIDINYNEVIDYIALSLGLTYHLRNILIQ